MSAIGGYVSFRRGRAPAEACAEIISYLARFGPEDQQSKKVGTACFGRALRRTLPEDDFDRQPLLGGGGRYLFVADARIDNREELAAELGLDPQQMARMSDADVLLSTWERWQLGCFDRLLGDVALAVWDSHDGKLTLARSAIASKPLFYAEGPDFVAFSSMPQALNRLPELPGRVDVRGLAAFAMAVPYQDERTLFEGVRLLRHGHAIQFGDGTSVIRRIWNPHQIPIGSSSGRDYAEALRSELDRAVRVRLRRRSGPVVTQLSAGRDSSAVTATAALIQKERGESLIAVTGAPRAGFDGPAVFGRIADESSLAAETAALHPNIRHLVCRTEPLDINFHLSRLNAAHFGPVVNVLALHWWTSVNNRTAAEDATVVLGAGTGNLSISAGGLRHLGDLWRLGGSVPWLRTAWGRAGLSPEKWRTVLNFTFGPSVPKWAYNFARRMAGRQNSTFVPSPAYLGAEVQAEAAQLLAEHYYADPRPDASNDESRRSFLLERDVGDKQTLAVWGLDLRDPTADRRLVELCLSLPPNELISAHSERPAYERAFADRLPQAVLKNTRRGYQGADWYEYYNKEQATALLDAYRGHRLVGQLFDLDAFDEIIASWPSGGWGKPPVMWKYGAGAAVGLSLANFVSLHFAD